MSIYARIKQENFKVAIRNELTTVRQFAKRIGTSDSYLNRLYSNNSKEVCSSVFAKRVLKGFKQKKYGFEDLFFWVE